MHRQPLDLYDEYPQDMLAYIRNYGWHFNKKAYEYAVSQMKTRNKEKMTPVKKEEFETAMRNYGITLTNDTMYDGAYVWCMAVSDFYQSSLPSEQNIAMYVKDVVDDVDAPDGAIFAKWYACQVRGGKPIDWEELL